MSVRASAIVRAGLVSVVAALCVPASANDTSLGGPASALYPIDETRITMVSERIDATLVQVPNDHDDWSIRAEYEFRNDTDATIELRVGFPELCEREILEIRSDRRRNLQFRDFRTRVNGVDVAVEVGQADRSRPELERMCRVYHFQAEFPPGTTRIVHEYVQSPSVSIFDDIHFDYITETGAYWNGAIGSATFTLHVPWWPSSVDGSSDPASARWQSLIWSRRRTSTATLPPGEATPTSYAPGRLSYVVPSSGVGFTGRLAWNDWDGAGNVHIRVGLETELYCMGRRTAPPCPALTATWPELAEASDLMIQDCVHSLADAAGEHAAYQFLLNPELHALGPGPERSALYDRVRLESARRTGACDDDGPLPPWLACSRAAVASVIEWGGSGRETCEELIPYDAPSP